MRAVVLSLCVAACDSPSHATATSAAPAREDGITVRDPNGAPVLALHVTDGHCAATGAATLDLAAGDADPLAGKVRIARAPGHVDVIDLQGVPLAHISIDDTAATVSDAGRAPVARATVAGDRVAVAGADHAALAYVTGTTDLEVAALVTAPGVPADVRATLACQKLLQ